MEHFRFLPVQIQFQLIEKIAVVNANFFRTGENSFDEKYTVLGFGMIICLFQ